MRKVSVNRIFKRFIVFPFLLVSVIPNQLSAATPVKKVRAAFTAFAYANPPFWIAKDLRLFEKYGLDVELVYVAGARNMRESYESYGKQLDQNLRSSPEGIKFILDFLADQRLTVKTKNPADFVDFRFVGKLEEEGFFKRLETK